MKVGHELGLDVTVAPAFSLVDAQNTSRDVFETQEQFEKELDMRYSAHPAFHMDFCTMWQALGAAHHTLRKRFGSLVLVFLLSGFTSAFAQNPVPFINQPLVPGAVAPGSPGFTLTVSGTGFALGATVNWNGTPLTTNFASSSQLTAVVLAGNILTAGTASVTVVNPGTSTASNVVSFSVVAPSSTVGIAPALSRWETPMAMASRI